MTLAAEKNGGSKLAPWASVAIGLFSAMVGGLGGLYVAGQQSGVQAQTISQLNRDNADIRAEIAPLKKRVEDDHDTNTKQNALVETLKDELADKRKSDQVFNTTLQQVASDVRIVAAQVTSMQDVLKRLEDREQGGSRARPAQ